MGAEIESEQWKEAGGRVDGILEGDLFPHRMGPRGIDLFSCYATPTGGMA